MDLRACSDGKAQRQRCCMEQRRLHVPGQGQTLAAADRKPASHQPAANEPVAPTTSEREEPTVEAGRRGDLRRVRRRARVAARGRVHYRIAKASSGTVTKTSIELLDAEGRQEEIARMLSGAEVTPEARAQADRLLEGV